MAGFELASSRGGPSIWEVLKAAGFEGKTAMKDFRAKMDKLGIPKDLGQKNSQALKWLNKNSKLKYVPLSDELLELEKSMGLHGSSKADKYFKRPERRIALSQRLSKVQEWAHEKFGKKTTMPKLEGIVNKLKDIPLIAKKGTDFLMKLGFRMTLGPSMIGADLMTEEAAGPIAEILSDKKEPLTYRGGGMANINTMTAPLGYKDAGEVGPREDIIQKTNEMITYLNARVAEQSLGTEPAARIINDITEERRKENPDYDRLNEMYSQYKSMDDFAMKVYFTDKYDEPEKKGRSEKGFLNRILNTIHDVTMRPKDAEIGYNAGGLASISQMTRPIHMNNGGETKTATASGMHPLVEWKEIYDAWIIDGGEEMPLWDFIEMMTKGIKKG